MSRIAGFALVVASTLAVMKSTVDEDDDKPAPTVKVAPPTKVARDPTPAPTPGASQAPRRAGPRGAPRHIPPRHKPGYPPKRPSGPQGPQRSPRTIR